MLYHIVIFFIISFDHERTNGTIIKYSYIKKKLLECFHSDGRIRIYRADDRRVKGMIPIKTTPFSHMHWQQMESKYIRISYS